ncbi:hypothetical protein M9458_053844, partial [Cirrhinus mrigala]
ISEDEVCQVFRKNKRRKAPGPDGVTPACLKICADQLAPIFSQIFNRSLELCEVPSCFKRSTIIPVPKKTKITGLNDYRPVALTSVVMKSFEKLVLAYLKNITGPPAVCLQSKQTRDLCEDPVCAFNTIIPTLLQTKLNHLSVPSSVNGSPAFCQIGSSWDVFSLHCSSPSTPMTAPPRPLCQASEVDNTLIGLIQDGEESAYRQEVKELAVWCRHNNLELNTLKTVEMIIDFRRNPPALTPLSITDSTVATVETFKFLGSVISQDLKWVTHINSIVKKKRPNKGCTSFAS